MNKQEQLKNKLEAFKELKQIALDLLKEVVTDKSIPLEDRWNCFIKSNLGEHSQWYKNPDGINWNKYTLYDDFHTDKYASITAESFVNICKDIISDQEEDVDEGRKINLNEVKEYFMKNLLIGFTNDW